MTSFNVDLSILIPAFLCGLIVLSTHVPLGKKVLEKGIIFIDLALAQIAGLGVIVANYWDWDSTWQVQLAAIVTALAGAILLRWFERRFTDIQEALIGVLFVLSASIAILLLADNPHGGEHLKDLLVGQILWVSYSQLMIPAIIYSLLLFAWFVLRLPDKYPDSFYLIFAVAITISVQLIGVYLVFASLIIPALATRKVKNKIQQSLAFAYGGIGYGLGLFLSAVFDLPSGAVIVCSLAICGLLGSKLVNSNRFYL